MDPNFDRLRQRLDNIPGGQRFENFRRRFRRSSNGKLLGVFSGIAESRGYSVCKVRWIGVAVLLFIATTAVEAHGLKATLVVCGFFYLLAAMLMQSPRASIGGMENPPPMPTPPSPGYGGGYGGGAAPYPGPMPTGRDASGLRADRPATRQPQPTHPTDGNHRHRPALRLGTPDGKLKKAAPSPRDIALQG